MDIKKPSAFYKSEWLIVILIGVALSLPMLVRGFPSGNDLPHHFRLALGFYDSFVNGDLYPSWLSMTNDGYGDPSVRFYPPGLYFLLSIFRSIIGEWYAASILTFGVLTFMSSVGAYVWAKAMGLGRYTLLAALVYPLTPFHTNELYQAAMYGQYAAACFLPFVFAFVERVFRYPTWTNSIGLALSYAAVILFHVPMAIFTAIAIAVYVGIKLIQNFEIRKFGLLCFSGILALGLSCFYWIPVIIELRWKYPSGAGQGEWFNYNNNFIFTTLPGEAENYWIPILLGVTGLLVFPGLVTLVKRNRDFYAAAILALFTFLLSTKLTKPIWDALPLLQETQFPWRWLTLTSLFLTILAVAGLRELHNTWKTRNRVLALLIIGLLTIILAFTVSQVVRSAVFIDRPDFNTSVSALRGSATNQDFLPIWAAVDKSEHHPEVETSRKAEINDWSLEHKQFSIVPGPPEDARLKLFYYPYWKAYAGHEQLNTRPDEKGRLLVSIPADAVTIDMQFVEPLSSRISGVISLTCLLICAGLIVIEKLRWFRSNSSPMSKTWIFRTSRLSTKSGISLVN